MAVDGAEIGLDLVLVEVHRRRDDVARVLAAQLDDVLAEIGLDRRDAGLGHRLVERDLLAHHGLALGDRLGVQPAGRICSTSGGPRPRWRHSAPGRRRGHLRS
jgi:hypothetical protein